MYSLIIVDYNTIEKTISYIEQIKISIIQDGSFHIIIVDTGDRKDCIRILEKAYGVGKVTTCMDVDKIVYTFNCKGSVLIYCQANENLGYARGNNLGAKIAQHFYQDDYFIFSNNDIVTSKEIPLSDITSIFVAHPEINIIGPRVLTPAGTDQSPHKKQNAFTRLVKWYWVMAAGLRNTMLISDICYQGKSQECYWVTGCFVFVKASAFFQVGMFDENTFLYAEEMILSERMLRYGFINYFYNDIEIIHNHSETVKKSISVLRNLCYSYESNYYYYKNYRNTSQLLLIASRLNFYLYKLIYRLKQIIKKLIGYEKR